jgi:hypothetical protein
MSEKENAETTARKVLVDADVFISYLTSDKLRLITHIPEWARVEGEVCGDGYFEIRLSAS